MTNRSLGQLIQKKEPVDKRVENGSVKPSLVGYDFHGTLNTGIVPSDNSVVITGADEDQESEIQSYLKKIGREDIPYHIMPDSIERGAENIGKWKAKKIKELGVSEYYEDDSKVIESIKKRSSVKIVPVGDAAEKEETDKFLFISTFGEILDMAIQVQNEGNRVLLCVPHPKYKRIGDGIIDKTDNWHEEVGKGWIWVVDGCETASLQDWLREQGECVIGTNSVMSEIEEDRQKGQDLFRKTGFNQPESKNFTDIDEAIDFVQSSTDKRWILKQNGKAPKSVNHMGKFKGSVDMLYHLNDLKKKWNDHQYGPFDCDLMEVVDGTEIAASAFWNGHDWLRDSKGKAVCFLNFEEKKETDGGLGETVGETGTTFYGTTEENPIAKDILFKPEIEKVLKDSDYRGVFDINGSLTDKGFVAFEATSRFGVPASSYEFIAGLNMKTSDLLSIIACGKDEAISIKEGWGMVVVVAAKPYPYPSEADIPPENTSIGERLWILDDDKPVDDFTAEQKKRIHLENFYMDDEGNYKVATPDGYLLVVSGSGSGIKSVRNDIIEYIKENIYISGMKYRQDIGERVEDSL